MSQSTNFHVAADLTRFIARVAILGAALGIVQGLTLRQRALQTVFWIGISIVSWVAAGWIGKVLIPLSYEWGSVLFWIGLFFSGTVLSSAGLMWLLGQDSISISAASP